MTSRDQLLFSLFMIVGGILMIAVRRRVNYPPREHGRSEEIMRIVGGALLIPIGAAGLLALLYRAVASG